VRALDEAGVAYMVTGSMASSLQGEPRATHDIDLVVALDAAYVARLADALADPSFYLDVEQARQAVLSRRMFNLIDTASGAKVDFWPLTDGEFDASRFARRRREAAFGFDLIVSSPEDTILMKLKWAKDSGGSEKQVSDALRVYEVQAEALDGAYMDEWAARLEVADLLARVREIARPL
jgi:hypothetical protein